MSEQEKCPKCPDCGGQWGGHSVVCYDRQLAAMTERVKTFSMENAHLQEENERLQKARECSDEDNALALKELARQLIAMTERAEKAERDRDQMLQELDGLQCDIASALGWDCGGVPFADLVRGYVEGYDAEWKRRQIRLQPRKRGRR